MLLLFSLALVCAKKFYIYPQSMTASSAAIRNNELSLVENEVGDAFSLRSFKKAAKIKIGKSALCVTNNYVNICEMNQNPVKFRIVPKDSAYRIKLHRRLMSLARSKCLTVSTFGKLKFEKCKDKQKDQLWLFQDAKEESSSESSKDKSASSSSDESSILNRRSIKENSSTTGKLAEGTASLPDNALDTYNLNDNEGHNLENHNEAYNLDNSGCANYLYNSFECQGGKRVNVQIVRDGRVIYEKNGVDAKDAEKMD
ncbi:hypothetical protein ENBRE01_2367, partial [Enteropsectra breve]